MKNVAAFLRKCTASITKSNLPALNDTKYRLLHQSCVDLNFPYLKSKSGLDLQGIFYIFYLSTSHLIFKKGSDLNGFELIISLMLLILSIRTSFVYNHL